MSQWNVQNQPCLWLVAVLTAESCCKVVHELYVPNEIRQECIFLAMTYAVGSLAFQYVIRIWNSQPCSVAFWCAWVCAHRKLRFFIFYIFSPYCDIVLQNDATCTNPDYILQYVDTIHSNIQLSPTMESNNVNFLDLSITRRPTWLGINIFRKPTSTDTTINFLPNDPLEHIMAAYRFLINRMLSLPLDKKQQDEEWQHISHIAHNKGIPPLC